MPKNERTGENALCGDAPKRISCVPSVIALGFFDGVHLGHGDLLARTAAVAAASGRRSAALTFDRSPGKDGRLLTTVADRVRLILSCYGIDEVMILPFTEEFMRLPWDAFLEALVRDYSASHLVCGWDYRFGYQGRGTPAMLEKWCQAAGLGCDVIEPRVIDGVTVSSTHLKTLIETGQTEAAIRFYGHPHTLTGVVRPGRRLGHRLGFPTANLLPSPELVLPKDGVYAVCGTVEGKTYSGVCNVGTNPTVGGSRRTVETWLSGFAGDLYGRELTVDFYLRLREERKFESLDALREEIERNQAQAEAYFSKSERFGIPRSYQTK